MQIFFERILPSITMQFDDVNRGVVIAAWRINIQETRQKEKNCLIDFEHSSRLFSAISIFRRVRV